MSDVAAYHVFVCALFTGAGRYVDCSPHTSLHRYTCSLMMICDVLSKHVGAVKVF